MRQLVFKCSDVLMNVTNYLAFMSTAKCHNFIHFIWQKKIWTFVEKKQGRFKWIPLLNLKEPIADCCGTHWWSTSFIHLNTLLIFSLQISTFLKKTCKFCLSTYGWNASCEMFWPCIFCYVRHMIGYTLIIIILFQ